MSLISLAVTLIVIGVLHTLALCRAASGPMPKPNPC